MANKVLEVYANIDYALVERTNEKGEVYEYVCAWAYDKKTNTWGQGHYFFDKIDALVYLRDRLINKDPYNASLLDLQIRNEMYRV